MEYRGNSENVAVVTMLAASGVVCAWLMDVAIGGFPEGELTLVMLGAGLGAAAAGILVAPWFGQPGAGGWVLAAFAALIATAIGGVLGGALYFVLDPVLNPNPPGLTIGEPPGLWQFALTSGGLVLALLTAPLFGLPWLAMMAAIHLVSRLLRG